MFCFHQAIGFSKHGSEFENEVILLMITGGKKWHYLVLNCLSKLLPEITSKNNSDYYGINCVYALKSESKLQSYETVCNNYGYCHMEMPEAHSKIHNYIQDQKSMKIQFIIYTDTESLLTIYTQTACGYSRFTEFSLNSKKCNHDFYRGENSMRKFCRDLREHAMEIIVCEKMEMSPLIKKEKKPYTKQNLCKRIR